jgi:hypothetical protein
MKFELSEGDIKALKGCIDLAIKSAGLQAAEIGVYLSRKLENPIKEETKKDEPTTTEK